MTTDRPSSANPPGDVLGSVFIAAQAGLLGSFVIVGIIAATTPGANALPNVVLFFAALVVVTLIGRFAPFARTHPNWVGIIALVDIVLVGGLRGQLEFQQPGLTILVVIPVLWLSYSYGVRAVIVAIVGDYLVALYPYIESGDWPSSSAHWGDATVLPAIISVVAIAVNIAAGRLRSQIATGLDAASAAVTVVESVDAAITLYDREGVVMLTNDAARAELVARHSPDVVLDVFAADGVTPVPQSDRVVELAARGELVTRRMYWINTGGESRAFMATSQYVRRASGEIIGTVVASHDVTPLAEAIEARDQFLATVSHELRTPLTSILGYLEVIEDSLDLATSSVAKEFAIVQRNSRRLDRLIGDLLTTANEQARIERRPYDLVQLARKSVAAVRAEAATAGLTLSLLAPAPVVADVDADHIGIVLDKLIANALRFTPRGGSIEVSVERSGTDGLIEIADSGVGIEADELPRVFERFYRGSAATSTATSGAGLGLSTAKVIVEAHGGTIDLTSAPGVGTRVTVRLPVASTAHRA